MGDTTALFSVVTPTRNALPMLRRCVGSVRGQQGVSVEHLVQDAASTDGSAAWLMAQSSRPDAPRTSHRLHAVSEPDGGMYDAINRGWARSGGQYLSWLNADEQYLPGTLARVQSHFEACPGVDALFGDYLVADVEGRAVALRREIPLRRFYVINTFLNAQSCTLFFRRRLLDRGLLELDTRLRYAADKLMILGLLDAGVRVMHLPEVFGVFGVDGRNLSTHPGMQDEAEQIRISHGAFSWRPLRQLAYGGRRIERLLRGAYRSSSLDYRFALDEVPTYAEFHASRLGGRYSLSDTSGSADRVDGQKGSE